MQPGNIVEFIDKNKIICGVVLEEKKQRLELIIEDNKKLICNNSRIIHLSTEKIDLSDSVSNIVKKLIIISNKRKELAEKIDIEELWEILEDEKRAVDIKTVAGLCFPDAITSDAESAVIRACFNDDFYFKLDIKDFSPTIIPNSENQIKELKKRKSAEDKKKTLIEEGSNWLKKALNNKVKGIDSEELFDILSSFYILKNESRYFKMAKAILDSAKITDEEAIFKALVNADVWDKDENLDIIQYDIPISFNDLKIEPFDASYAGRVDLTNLNIITIDGKLTRDFDDALSIEKKDNSYILGIHISDVGHFIKKKGGLDEEAKIRVSSIYMPDDKISMFPPELSEEICSLKKDEIRPAISAMITLDNKFEMKEYKIIASIVKVSRQSTYEEVALAADKDESISLLYKAAKAFRQKRFDNNAVQITLPEIDVKFSEDNEIIIEKIDKESVSKILVSELMIMANFIMGKFLQEHNTSAIFRAQPQPQKRLYKGDEGTLYQNWIQRKYIARFVLSDKPEQHSGLGLDLYTTATSPIRKYFDLITQRQIKSILGLEIPYSSEEISEIINLCSQTSSNINKIQTNRKRYWILKYLETKTGKKEKALVIGKYYNNYQIVLTAYMFQCYLPISSGVNLKEEDNIEVIISYASARKNILSVYLMNK